MDETQESSAINEIIKFQVDRELHKKHFDGVNESASIIEELLESHGMDVPKENRPQLKKAWKTFLNSMDDLDIADPTPAILETDIVDAYADIIVFSVGALLKLGYHVETTLSEVAKEINSREGQMVDGKFEKDLSDEAKAKWYKADYSKAKYKNFDS